MKTSESISNLTKALLVAQKQMGGAVKGAKNPFFRSSYADLPTVMEVVKEPLNDAGIIVLQPAAHRDGRNFIDTVLVHAETGEMLVSSTEVICSKPNDPQAFGAAQTYARRFGLQAMVFIPSEDDDGNKAAGRAVSKATQVSVPATLPTPITTEQVKSLANSAGAASNSSPAALTATNALPLNAVQATAQTVTEVKPLKPSSFRKPKVAVTEVATGSADAGWES